MKGLRIKVSGLPLKKNKCLTNSAPEVKKKARSKIIKSVGRLITSDGTGECVPIDGLATVKGWVVASKKGKKKLENFYI